MLLKPRSFVSNERALLYRRYTELDQASGSNGYYKTQDNKCWQFDKETQTFFNVSISGLTPTNITTNSTRLRYLDKAFYYDGTQWVGFNYLQTEFNSGEKTIGYSGYVSVNIPFNWENGANVGNTIYFDSDFDKDITITHIYIPVSKWKSDTTHKNTRPQSVDDINIVAGSKNNAIALGNAFHFYGDNSNILQVLLHAKNVGETAQGSFTIKLNYGQLDQMNYPYIQKIQANKYYYAGSFNYMIKGGIQDVETQNLRGNIMNLQTFNIRYFDDSIGLDHDDLIVINDRLYSVEDISKDIKRNPKPYTIYFATLNSMV